MLIIKKAFLCFLEQSLFKPISLQIAGGEICVLSAPSGAGKSTLLRWIAGMPTDGLAAQGQIFLNNRQIDHLPSQDRRVGMMFQTPLLFPHLTVQENLGFGLPRRIKGADRQIHIQQALDRAGLSDTAERDPETLSGGQQARIALLRALLAQPEALLLDEPFSSLDDERRGQIIDLVSAEALRLNLPVLLVSHDPRDSQVTNRRIVTLEAEPVTA